MTDKMRERDVDPGLRWLAEGLPGIARDVEAAQRLWPLLREHYGRRPGVPGGGGVEGTDFAVLVEAGAALAELIAASRRFRAATDALRRRLPAVAAATAAPGCMACGAPGPLRRGLCDRCRKRFTRSGAGTVEEWLSHSVPSSEDDASEWGLPPAA